jgi:hypothetical protein
MTKTIILGDASNKSIHKDIQFFSSLLTDFAVEATQDKPRQYKYIELICFDYAEKLDLMFAYDDPNNRSDGVLFVGKWNNGTVSS